VESFGCGSTDGDSNTVMRRREVRFKSRSYLRTQLSRCKVRGRAPDSTWRELTGEVGHLDSFKGGEKCFGDKQVRKEAVFYFKYDINDLRI